MELTTVAAALAVGTAVDLIGVGDWGFLDVVGVADTVGVAARVGELAGFVAVGLGVVAVTVGDARPSEGVVGCADGRALAVGVDWLPRLPGADDWPTAGAVLVADPVALFTGSVTELTMDPSAPVTGSVTAWRTPETVPVRPDSGDGWSPVAAYACVDGSDRSKQIPPVPVAIRAARTTARRVFGFDIENSQSQETRAWHAGARPWGTIKLPGQPSGHRGSGELFGHHRTVSHAERTRVYS